MANQHAGHKRERHESSGESSPPTKRQSKDPSFTFTKAVIICNSSELSKSEEKRYRPNNIVVELLKKNPKRYGKVMFTKVANEEEIRGELCLRFPVLRNKTVLFASADQYGKLNFRGSEKWTGRNVRRWLPGSSAMYLILEGEDEPDEPVCQPQYSTVGSNPSSGLSYTTMHTSPTNEAILTWKSSRSQRALLDFLSSPERAKIDESQRRTTFAMNCGRAKACGLPRSHSYPGFCAVSNTAVKTEKMDSDLEFRDRLKHFRSSKHCKDTNSSLKPNIASSKLALSESRVGDINTPKDFAENRSHHHNNNFSKTTRTQSVLKTTSPVYISSSEPKECEEDVAFDFKRTELNSSSMDHSFDYLSFNKHRGINIADKLRDRKTITTRSELIRKTIQTFVQASSNHSTHVNKHDSSVTKQRGQSHEPRRLSDFECERNHGCATLKPEKQNGGVCDDGLRDFENRTTKVNEYCSSEETETHTDDKKQNCEPFRSEKSNGFENKNVEVFDRNGEENLKVKSRKHRDTICGDDTSRYEKENGDTFCSDKSRMTSGENVDIPPCFVPCYMLPSPLYPGHFYPPMTSFAPAFCIPRNSGVTWKQGHDSLRSDHVMYKGNMIVPVPLAAPYKEMFSDGGMETSRMDVDESAADQHCEDNHENVRFEIIPTKGTCKGGETFVVLFKDPLHQQLSVTFGEVAAMDLTMDNPYVLKGKTPEFSEPGLVTVTISTKTGEMIGRTSFIYLDDVTEGSTHLGNSPTMTSPSETEKNQSKDVSKNVTTSDTKIDDKQESRTEAESPSDLKADNLLLLSSIASKIKHHTTTNNNNNNNKTSILSISKPTEPKHTDCKKESNPAFHKKVFILPPNSLYLPSQSNLCKLRMTGKCYSKILFHALMSEDDVIHQIRKAFPDLKESRLRLAIVDQTGKLVFNDDIWTGKTIRKKLRGNSVLYVAPYMDCSDVIR